MPSISDRNTKRSVSFKWENHQEKLLQRFRSMLNNGHLTDVTLAAGGKFLSAHRVILSAYSSYFEELLSLHKESQTIVVFQDIAFDELQMLVDFMYKGEMEIEYAKIASFFETAQSLKIHALMQHQGPEETAPSLLLRIPTRSREAECPVEAAGHDSRQASGSNEGIIHPQQVHNQLPFVEKAVDLNNRSQSPAGLEIQTEASDCGSNEGIIHPQQVHNQLPFVEKAVDLNNRSQSPAGLEIQTEASDCARESEDLRGEGWDNEDNSITIMKEEIIVPCYELFPPGGVLNAATTPNESGNAQQSLKLEPQSFDAQDFNHGLSAFANNFPSRSVSKTPPDVEAKDNNADPDDKISSATGQHEQIEAPELTLAGFRDSGTNGNEASDLEAWGPSGLANRAHGKGISNANSRYSLRKRTSAAILQPSKTGSLPGTSRSEASTPELSASASSVQLTARITRRGKTPNFVCLQCSKGYSLKHNLRRHERLFCGREPPAFVCRTCDKRFTREYSLKQHDAVHNSRDLFVCTHCSKSYIWEKNLAMHERICCGKEPSFACGTCDKQFYREDHLKRHCAAVHELGET